MPSPHVPRNRLRHLRSSRARRGDLPLARLGARDRMKPRELTTAHCRGRRVRGKAQEHPFPGSSKRRPAAPRGEATLMHLRRIGVKWGSSIHPRDRTLAPSRRRAAPSSVRTTSVVTASSIRKGVGGGGGEGKERRRGEGREEDEVEEEGCRIREGSGGEWGEGDVPSRTPASPGVFAAGGVRAGCMNRVSVSRWRGLDGGAPAHEYLALT